MAKHFEATPTAVIPELAAIVTGRMEIPGETRSLVVGVDRMRIGRAPQCALVLDDPSVSALHIEVRSTAKGVQLVDLQSKNGTFIAGNRIVEVYLNAPTDVVCGRRTLRFVPGAPSDPLLALATECRFGTLVGATPSMRTIIALLQQYAGSDLPMVITGETGTGKEVVARAVHNASPRAKKPFVPVNCAAMMEGLLETELFGHVRGAFTGADRDKRGLFEEADGGTLFFDELGEMSPGMQAKLLRVLEDGVVRRVGATQQRKLNVRVLAATNTRLPERINQGAFREDLYFRLAQLTVDLPPLRERVADLPLLVSDLLRELGREDVVLDERSLGLLQARSWPGNVRELRALLARAVFGAPAGALSLDQAFHASAASLGSAVPAGAADAVLTNLTWVAAKEETRRRYYTALWGECRGNVTQVAKRAGIERQAARKALRKIGLDADDDRLT
jgi:DNA-binding NtrC family response regulator